MVKSYGFLLIANTLAAFLTFLFPWEAETHEHIAPTCGNDLFRVLWRSPLAICGLCGHDAFMRCSHVRSPSHKRAARGPSRIEGAGLDLDKYRPLTRAGFPSFLRPGGWPLPLSGNEPSIQRAALPALKQPIRKDRRIGELHERSQDIIKQ